MLSPVLDDVRPFLRRPLSPTEDALAGSLLEAMTVLLNTRYPDRITPENQAYALFIMGQSLSRIVTTVNPNVIKEGVEGGNYVEYAAHTTKGELFTPTELAGMDSIYGGKSSLGTLTVRFGW